MPARGRASGLTIAFRLKSRTFAYCHPCGDDGARTGARQTSRTPAATFTTQ
jgi:hypothetical protein